MSAGAVNVQFEFSNGILDQTDFCADTRRLHHSATQEHEISKPTPKRANEYSLEPYEHAQSKYELELT
jgi:hypothetical protein